MDAPRLPEVQTEAQWWLLQEEKKRAQ